MPVRTVSIPMGGGDVEVEYPEDMSFESVQADVVRRARVAKEVGGQIYDGMHWMDKAALWTMPIPLVGDLSGVIADARMFIQDPSSRTKLNAGLAAMGAIPLIPAASTIRHAKKLTDAPLDMTQAARMELAEGQGYNVDEVFYHGTDNPGIAGFRENTFLTRDPQEAGEYAARAYTSGGAETIYPVRTKTNKIFDIDNDADYQLLRGIDEDIADTMKDMDGRWDYVESYLDPNGRKTGKARQALIDEGYDGIYVREAEDRFPGDEMERSLMIFDPANIRSVNAAFDPAKKDSANLLAGIGGGAVLTGAVANEKQKQNQNTVPLRARVN